MTIDGFKYFPFSLKFNKPFNTSSQIITERSGFIISLSDELGNNTFGECTPLPGFSSETIEDAERILKGLKHQMIGFNTNENLDSVSDLLSEFVLVPSLKFALEQAILGLLIKRDINFLSNNFRNTRSEINVNAVIGFGEEETILSSIQEKIKKGYHTFKIKIGRDDFELDYKLIRRVHEYFKDSIIIRLDANRKWNYENAKSYLERLNQFGIEYIEEPSNSLENNLLLAQTTTTPIALDESLSSVENVFEVLNNSDIEHIILKPMVYSGIINSLKIIHAAATTKKKVIISSSFESAVGKSALVLLASLTNHSHAHGLDTSEFFRNDICKDPFEVKNGKIVCDHSNYPLQFDFVIP